MAEIWSSLTRFVYNIIYNQEEKMIKFQKWTPVSSVDNIHCL